MKEFFKKIMSKDEWLIEEEDFRRDQQGHWETLFTLGNGYIGSRGVLEEIPYDSYAGTYIAGIYDNTGAIVPEIVNLPNPVFFRIISRGEKLDPIAMDVLEHKRILDMQKGVLFRKTVYSNHKGERFDYQSMRFFCMHNKHIGAMRIYLTPQDATTDITVETGIDTSITNIGMLTEGRKRHFQVVEVSVVKNVHYLCIRTFEKNILISYGYKIMAERNGKRLPIRGNILRFRVKKGETVCFTKIFTIYTSYDVKPTRLKYIAVRNTKKCVQLGLDHLLKRHIRLWKEKWKHSDIVIEGDREVEKALRFNIYHLTIAGNRENGKASIGARTLSGEGYRGHIFWDFEIFDLPFFIYTDPETARHLLLYRYNRLEEAKRRAEHKGYKGAMFPWESADTGKEVTPGWSKDLDGAVIEIHTMDMEDHITADIAYAVNHYYTATGDKEFMLRYGLEILFETARFWASRVEYSRKKRRYEIKGVMGPDEFHENVNNNAYTNIMAKWNLLRAIELYRQFCKKYPRRIRTIARHLKLTKSELTNWRNIAQRMITHIYKKRNIIEAFDGYFQLRDVPITRLDNNFMPLFPKKVTPKNVGRTQLVKQADVVMLLYLFSDIFSDAIKRKSYYYYVHRTLHKSSLSSSIHAIVGNQVGDEKAYQYFLNSVFGDLKGIYGDVKLGMHAASLGGTWQAVINGFAGINIRQDVLSIKPKLPSHWRGLRFKLIWRGYLLSISVVDNKLELYYRSKKKKDSIRLWIYDTLRQVPANRKVIFHIDSRVKSR